ncbi:orotidine-5'-phosphate decarboxylase [Runella aurantiaca]|jgi:orotidine-5'-phosphate decarboxylase|uniref:Orotidine-5'-phosphate decarboxylase n=1 Tax=Runella aurantiaca TaxID=2282308 RepID=A0A369I8L3_9BACT|nr:orotidine-5'-phosphate decarboxylase [Runella aurantiaca]RDB03016.1 orotidine-5'-phosphate decarboxylase [Runella aurantiaca]
MNRTQLIEQIKRKKSFLCVGLDPDLKKLPKHILREPDAIFEFNKRLIDATAPYAVAYKPNIAFYEALGPRGWNSLQRTLGYIPKDCFTIADAKRGDIGNTSSLYAQAFFDKGSSGMSFDSITVAPYMGRDSVIPFLEFKDKWVILLALTSNEGSADFQTMMMNPKLSRNDDDDFGLSNSQVVLDNENEYLFERVIRVSQQWGGNDRLMYVVGATQAPMLQQIRKLAPEHFLLIPGVGAQGGSLEEVCKYGMTKECGLLVNASRSIIYASSGIDFAQKAGEEAKRMQQEMEQQLQAFKII